MRYSLALMELVLIMATFVGDVTLPEKPLLSLPKSTKPPMVEPPRESDRSPPLFVSRKTHDMYMSFWPKSDSEWLNELKTKRITFYDDISMPRAYQIFDGRGRDGIHNARVNFTGGRDKSGNANVEFPWDTAAGFLVKSGSLKPRKYDATGTFKGIRFMHLPAGKKITWWNSVTMGANRPLGLGWSYPEGTVFGELLLLTDSKGFDYTFEFRVREKRHDGTWDVDAYRPFRTLEEYIHAVATHESFVSQEEEPAIPEEFKNLQWRAQHLHDLHPARSFDRHGWTIPLPRLKDALGLKLLDVAVFKSVRGKPFATEGHGKETTFAPFSAHADQIVPKNYLGGLIKVSFKSCMGCHQDTDQSAVMFNSSRDWWGRVRGSDAILSFHPFDPSCVSDTGLGKGIKLRRELVASNMLRQWKER